MKSSGFDAYLKEVLKKDGRARKEYWTEFAQLPLATQIKILRRDKGLSQAELARKIRKRQPVIARLEKETYNATIKTLTLAAKALGAKVAIFPTG